MSYNLYYFNFNIDKVGTKFASSFIISVNVLIQSSLLSKSIFTFYEHDLKFLNNFGNDDSYSIF